MLDSFEVLTTSGIVLWSRVNVDLSSNVVNSLINDVFIEGKSWNADMLQSPDDSGHTIPSYKYEKYTLKWTLAKDLGLIFVVGEYPAKGWHFR